ncbi:MAG TPA: hypothetical protein DDX40_06535, partial [Rikenellaceae bacterium]|nr:hypothetical protein [Rikenellaceae bacterium]
MKIARKLPKVHGEMRVRIKVKKRSLGHEKPEGSKTTPEGADGTGGKRNGAITTPEGAGEPGNPEG